MKTVLRMHRKKRFTSFPSPAGMSLPKSPWAGIIQLWRHYSRPGGVWQWHSGWRRETREPFFTVWEGATCLTASHMSHLQPRRFPPGCFNSCRKSGHSCYPPLPLPPPPKKANPRKFWLLSDYREYDLFPWQKWSWYRHQCCGTVMIYCGSGSYFGKVLGSGSGSGSISGI